MASKKRKPAPGTWAAKLRALRERLDLTQVEMAERADVPARTWIAWENEQHVPGRMAQRHLKETFPELR